MIAHILIEVAIFCAIIALLVSNHKELNEK